MLDDFMIRAGLAALGVAMAAGVLGCFVVWRRMAYFGDATAHVAVLGVAMALMFGWSIFAGVGHVALTMAVLIYGLKGARPSGRYDIGCFVIRSIGDGACGGHADPRTTG